MKLGRRCPEHTQPLVSRTWHPTLISDPLGPGTFPYCGRGRVLAISPSQTGPLQRYICTGVARQGRHPSGPGTWNLPLPLGALRRASLQPSKPPLAAAPATVIFPFDSRCLRHRLVSAVLCPNISDFMRLGLLSLPSSSFLLLSLSVYCFLATILSLPSSSSPQSGPHSR